jgi:dUTP pyrophosphatase
MPNAVLPILAPNWTVKDVIHMVRNDGGRYPQIIIMPTDPPDQSYEDTNTPTRIEFYHDYADITGIGTVPRAPNYIRHSQAHSPITTQIKIQIDGGANCSITNNINTLIQVQHIEPYPIYGVSSDAAALQYTAKGYLPWTAEDGEIIHVPCFFSPNAAEPIISPTDVVLSHPNKYTAWAQFAHCSSGQGNITFYRPEGTGHTVFSLRMRNGLWYYEPPSRATVNSTTNEIKEVETVQGKITRLSSKARARYELFHQRLGHRGKKTMACIHKHIDGIQPLKGNAFYMCASCIHGKIRRRSIHKVKLGQPPLAIATTNDTAPDYLELIMPRKTIRSIGEMFYMDFGFVRGTGFANKDKTGKLVTSIDGYRAYLLIIEGYSRYVWILLTKTKHPPISYLTTFLELHGKKEGRRIIRTDKGGDLWGAFDFRKAAQNVNYLLEPTATDATFQNGMAERPNQTLGQMMRCLLHSANLGPEFWSFALIHAARLYNMVPHSSTGQTPHLLFTGNRPTAENLRVWGCLVYARNRGPRPHKLDYHTSTGLFLGYTATTKNIHFYDLQTKRLKTATHVIFDEANITAPADKRSQASTALIELGYTQEDGEPIAVNQLQTTQEPTVASIQLLSPLAKIPTRATHGAAGYDAYSTIDTILQPQTITKIPLDITIVPPMGSYVHIMLRSGLASNGVTTYAGVIDPDYRGNITVLLYHSGQQEIRVTKGDRIAQLLFLQCSTPQLNLQPTLNITERADNGFGSSGGAPTPLVRHNNASEEPAMVGPDLPKMPYNIYLSADPFDDIIKISVRDFGTHDTMGMIFHPCPYRNLPILKDIIPSQPGSRIRNWRSSIKNTYRVQIEEHIIHTISDIENAIHKSRAIPLQEIQFEFAVDNLPSGIHPTEGLPMLFADQLNIIAKNVSEITQDHKLLTKPGVTNTNTVVDDTPGLINNEDNDSDDDDDDDGINDIDETLADVKTEEEPLSFSAINNKLQELFVEAQPPAIRHLFNPSLDMPQEQCNPPAPQNHVDPAGQKLTQKQVQNSPEAAEWRQMEFKQLDMYEDQNMFGPPELRRPGMNVWKLLWTYVQKPPPDNRLKACAVCDGSKRGRRNAKIGHTFANSLAKNGERLFWALAAKKGMIVTGADVSNAFAEAPAPDEPLYILPNDAFRDWWANHKGRDPIPAGWVCRVNYALQGHPEAPRLWERHIDQILRKIGLKPTTHEPCLYSATIDGEYILFLRQVDDFALATSQAESAKNLMNIIDGHVRISIKHLGLLTLFNGMDILQTKYYIKLHCATYLAKI